LEPHICYNVGVELRPRLIPRDVTAYHEAAHAVLCELLLPGSVESIYIHPSAAVLKKYKLFYSTAAFVQMNEIAVLIMPYRDFSTICYAGLHAERKIGWKKSFTTSGDRTVIGQVTPTTFWYWRRRSKKLVRKHWRSIERLAAVLMTEDYMSGDQVREILRVAG
jgi:hypothetical protein